MNDAQNAAALHALSADLKRILELELSLGNAIQAVDVNAWSESPLVVTLQQPLHLAEIRATLGLPAGEVTLWENRDTHYSLERGFACGKTKHSIAGPLTL